MKTKRYRKANAQQMQAALTDLGEALTGDIDVFPIIQPMMLTVGKAFNQFIQTECKSDDTFRFWYRFVFEDCFSYIALHTVEVKVLSSENDGSNIHCFSSHNIQAIAPKSPC